MKFCILMLIAFSALTTVAVAADVKNIKVGQSGNKAVATYDLVSTDSEQEAEVTVVISIDGVKRTADGLKITGDFGKGVKVGPKKKIIWDASADLPSDFDGELSWDVQTASVSETSTPEEKKPVKKAKKAKKAKKSVKANDIKEESKPDDSLTSIPGAGEIGRDGRFIAYDDGTVLDTITHLMWAAKDNGGNINWGYAKSYCDNYRGGGYTDWRMPTQIELESLYDPGKTRTGACRPTDSIHFATELIDISCFAPWASETKSSNAAGVNFLTGTQGWLPQTQYIYTRALPVRSGNRIIQ